MFRSFAVIKRLISDVSCKMLTAGVVPDLICAAPNEQVSVTYTSACVELGNEVKPADVHCVPSLKWCAVPGSYYTIFLLDLDAPCRTNPVYRCWLHWLIGNVPCNDVAKGQIIAGYIGALPPKNTDFHRYVFLLYKQCCPVRFTEPCIPSSCAKGRTNFILKCFVDKYRLGDPVAGNFFVAQWDCYVDEMNRKLGIC